MPPDRKWPFELLSGKLALERLSALAALVPRSESLLGDGDLLPHPPLSDSLELRVTPETSEPLGETSRCARVTCN